MADIYQELARIAAAGEEAALVTIVAASGSTPRGVGAKMLVRADGSILGTVGGGNIEAKAIEMALEAIKQGQPRQFHFDLSGDKEELGMICGGDTEVFIEPVLPPPTLYIFGAGHIALSLAKVGKLLGFRIAVIDNRAEFANSERFPEADLILAEEFGKAFSRIEINKLSYIVIVSHNHEFDELILEQALKTNAKYIGMIGSKTKNKAIFSHLLAKGISQELMDKVHAPIGLAINSETPEEIAISILAEIIKIRRSPT